MASQVCPEFKWLSFGGKHADMCTHRKTPNTWSQLSRLKEPWLTHLRKRTKKPLTESRILSSTKQSHCSQSSQSRPSELDCKIMIMLSFEWVLFPSMELLINKLLLWRSLCPHWTPEKGEPVKKEFFPWDCMSCCLWVCPNSSALPQRCKYFDFHMALPFRVQCGSDSAFLSPLWIPRHSSSHWFLEQRTWPTANVPGQIPSLDELDAWTQ